MRVQAANCKGVQSRTTFEDGEGSREGLESGRCLSVFRTGAQEEG